MAEGTDRVLPDERFSCYAWPTYNRWTAEELLLLQADIGEISELAGVPTPIDLDRHLEEIVQELQGEIEQIGIAPSSEVGSKAALRSIDTVSQIDSYLAAYKTHKDADQAARVVSGGYLRASEGTDTSHKRGRGPASQEDAISEVHRKHRHRTGTVGDVTTSQAAHTDVSHSKSSKPALENPVLKPILKMSKQERKPISERLPGEKKFAKLLFESTLKSGGFCDTLRFNEQPLQHHIFFHQAWLHMGARGPETRSDASINISPKIDIPPCFEERYKMPLISVSVRDATHLSAASSVQEAAAEFAAMLSIVQRRLKSSENGTWGAEAYRAYVVAIHGATGYISHVDFTPKYLVGINQENLADTRITMSRTPTYRLHQEQDLHKFVAMIYRLLHQLDYQVRIGRQV